MAKQMRINQARMKQIGEELRSVARHINVTESQLDDATKEKWGKYRVLLRSRQQLIVEKIELYNSNQVLAVQQLGGQYEQLLPIMEEFIVTQDDTDTKFFVSGFDRTYGRFS